MGGALRLLFTRQRERWRPSAVSFDPKCTYTHRCYRLAGELVVSLDDGHRPTVGPLDGSAKVREQAEKRLGVPPSLDGFLDGHTDGNGARHALLDRFLTLHRSDGCDDEKREERGDSSSAHHLITPKSLLLSVERFVTASSSSSSRRSQRVPLFFFVVVFVVTDARTIWLPPFGKSHTLNVVY